MKFMLSHWHVASLKKLAIKIPEDTFIYWILRDGILSKIKTSTLLTTVATAWKKKMGEIAAEMLNRKSRK